MKWRDGVQETDDIHAIHTLKAVTGRPEGGGRERGRERERGR
jgi:hypothetical protein